MEIQRCDFFIGDKYDPSRHDLMTDSDRGRFVLYANHLATLEAAVREKDADNRKLLDENIDFQNENAAQRGKIAALTAEAAKYREALEEIAGKCKDLDDYAPVSVEVGMIAQAALHTEGGER
jgi:hypothetical protein